MKEILVGKKTEKYIGEPLKASVYHGEEGWGGRSNFLSSNEETKDEIQLIDLKNCFQWMKKWSSLNSKTLPYIYGYILDYKTKTIYYDKEEALEHLLQKVFPAQKTENYFVNFIQKDFTK